MISNYLTHLNFLGAFAKLRKEIISFACLSVCLSICPNVYSSAWKNSTSIGQILMKFYI